MSNSPGPKFAVAQLGARMHYAVPGILAGAGLLERFYTDSLAPVSVPAPLFLSRRFTSVRRLMGRVPTGVPRELITSFQAFGLEYAARLSFARRRGNIVDAFLWAGSQFCRKVIAAGLQDADSVYAFNSAALELFSHARKRGIRCVLEQTIAPMAVEMRLLREEREAWPNWENRTDRSGRQQEYADREKEEWRQADTVLCGSDFVAEGIRACGGYSVNCAVVPYGVDIRVSGRTVRRKPSALRVLFVGTVGLRKGVQYLHETAGILPSHRFEFRAVGMSTLTDLALKRLRCRIAFAGPVPRASIHDHYIWADVLILPSLCEGSATVAYEALAAGLPVVATPNAGTVIRDGVEGFIVPARAPEIMAERLEQLLSEEGLLERMSSAALSRALNFTVGHYGQRLLTALELNGASGRSPFTDQTISAG